MYKAVFDTNVYVSAAAFGGKLEILFRLSWGSHRRFRLYTSNDILKETVRVLASDKFRFTREEISDTIATIVDAADVVEPKTKITVLSDDPDNRILECAVKTKADFIVSGDSHLVSLKEYKGIPILKPAQFLALLEKKQ
ncbi:MAG: putative toxin-antitoxin system toxin component, PIN family [Thermoleophilia bacterium]